LALAKYELPRRFSPGLARQQDLGFSQKLLAELFSSRIGVEQFLAKADLLLSSYPRAKAPGQLIFG
jgi:hypothetical protein